MKLAIILGTIALLWIIYEFVTAPTIPDEPFSEGQRDRSPDNGGDVARVGSDQVIHAPSNITGAQHNHD